MKLKHIWKYAVTAVACGTLAGVTSCNYLDVVPPEQPGLEDAMKTHQDALGFLYSCYAGTTDVNATPTEYTSPMCSSTDEYVLPYDQMTAYPQIRAAASNTQSTDLSNIHWLWGSVYRYIGQCLLFEEQLTTIGRENSVTASASEETEWLAEAKFLKAYYHYVLLRTYGPIPLTLNRIAMDAPESDFPGRSHFDYCVTHIVNELDEAALNLPDTRESIYYGRATSVMCKLIKARVLLLAASDLYNGKFPFPEWQNVNYQTPGYGRELVSKTYSRSKWKDAYDATQEAINAALAAGHSLMQDFEPEKDVPLTGLDWLPIDIDDQTELEAFQTKVLLNQYIHTTSQSQNPEILWSQKRTHNALEDARLPLKIVQNKDKQWYAWGWSVVNPTLNTVYNFYCRDGRLPAQGHDEMEFFPKNEWFEAAPNMKEGHEDIIKLMYNREPRFYAWIAFDGGNFLHRLKNGVPLTLNFKSDEAQGYQPSNEPKNYASTGLLAQKHITPIHMITDQLNRTRGTEHPVVMGRLTELYLNLAECAAELANTDRPGAEGHYADEAIQTINMIRDRAGVDALTADQIGINVNNPLNGRPKTMTLVEWVRQERFIELWDEGQRYYDIRRWVAGPEYLGAGIRQGLNAVNVNPDFETFNQPVVCNPTYTFGTRQYLYPVFINEVYKNPQMVQAPGF